MRNGGDRNLQREGRSLAALLVRQPPDGDQMLHGVKLRIADAARERSVRVVGVNAAQASARLQDPTPKTFATPKTFDPEDLRCAGRAAGYGVAASEGEEYPKAIALHPFPIECECG